MKIKEKLQGLYADLHVGKPKYNSFGNYSYRSCEDIYEAVKPFLHERQMVLTLSDDVVAFGGRIYVKATATLSDGEDSISVTGLARETKEKKKSDASQLTGAASSYARKYALSGLFLLDDVQDADATNKHGKEAVKETVKETTSILTDKQKKVAKLYNDDVEEAKRVKELLSINASLDQMTEEQLDMMIQYKKRGKQ